MEKEYITPTKESPVFQVTNTYEGYIVNDFQTYKDWSVGDCVGETTALSLPEAMGRMFAHIKDRPWMKLASFRVEMLDGTTDKWGDPIRTKVFSISMKQAKKFGLIK
ncbi:MAG: hypothetical protein BGO34_16990 [Bacteroidia bacterium 44-10]|nr:MAG: hypothetical protein BGO34_16990 [Bacteroidia bacterium 44-10]